MLPSKKCVKNNKFADFHIFNDMLTAKQFLTIKVNEEHIQKLLFDKVIVAAPEVALLQLTKTFPVHRIMLLAMEICGTYALNNPVIQEGNRQKTGFVSGLSQATNLKCLKNTCQSFNGSRLGNNKIYNDLLNWVAEGSASPAESKLYLLLCGPRKYGFFQINKFSLNDKIKLSKKASVLCGYSKIRPDLSNKEKKIAIEYDSKQFHENIEINQNDKMRTLALMHDGWKVISIVPKEMKSYDNFTTIVKDILRLMNQDTRIKNKNFEQKSKLVFNDIW